MLQPRQSPVVRRATPADLDCLSAIEQSADQAFRGTGVSLGEDISASPADTWQGALRALSIGVVLGLLVGLVLASRSRRGLKTAVPLGLFLAIGALVVLFVGESIEVWYWGS